MRNIHEALRVKEVKLERLKRDVQALHAAISLLKDEPQAQVTAPVPLAGISPTAKVKPSVAARGINAEWP